MKNFARRLKRLVSSKKSTPIVGTLPIDFVKTKKGILKELILSKQSGNVIGVYSKVLGDGMFLTVVEHIEPTPTSELISFNRYDMSGATISTTEIQLDEIHMVCPLNQLYRHPIFTSLKGEKAVRSRAMA